MKRYISCAKKDLAVELGRKTLDSTHVVDDVHSIVSALRDYNDGQFADVADAVGDTIISTIVNMYASRFMRGWGVSELQEQLDEPDKPLRYISRDISIDMLVHDTRGNRLLMYVLTDRGMWMGYAYTIYENGSACSIKEPTSELHRRGTELVWSAR